MPAPTDQEQLFLELINETRLDPLGNAARYISSYAPLTSSDPDIQYAFNYFHVNGAALLSAYSALTPVGPLAWNNALATAAEKYSALMIAADKQTHDLAGEASLGARILAEGYNYKSAAENIYAFSRSDLYGHAAFMVDWDAVPNGMQSPPGHRDDIMLASFREIGIDVTAESNPGTVVGPQVVTQEFAVRNGMYFVLGVAYIDANADKFYSIGEGRDDLTVQFGTTSTTSAASGGYSLAVNTGSINVILIGGGLSGPVTVTTAIAGENVKLDLVNGNTLLTSGSVSVSGPITVLRGLGVRGLSLAAGAGNQTIEGTSGNDTLNGGAGDDILKGGNGSDTAFFTGIRANYLVTLDAQGYHLVDQRAGPNDGSDLAVGVEHFLFADGDVLAANLLSNSPPPSAFQLISATGKVTIGGNGAIAGTNGVDDVSLLYGAITLDGSFNRGGDIVRMGGNANSYSIARSGSSTAIVTDNDDLRVAIPLGTVGLTTAFDDGTRKLVFDGTNYKIGTQSFDTNSAPIVAPSEGSAPLTTGAAGVLDTLIMAGAALQPGQSVHATIGGKIGIAGTNGTDVIAIADVGGTFVFDGSFNRGGDVIVLGGNVATYSATRQGSSTMVIATTDEQLTIPIGTVGLTLRFADGDRTLVFSNGKYLVGGQEITGTTPNQLNPPGVPAMENVVRDAADDTPAIGNSVPSADSAILPDAMLFPANPDHQYALALLGGNLISFG